MHIWPKGTPNARAAGLVAAGSATIFALLAGCAAPGPPLPPTLNLPEVVSASGLTATRAGSEVTLHWTTPKQTTDKLPIKGPITALICREAVAAPARQVATPRCTSPAGRFVVTPGDSQTIDTLPDALTAGPARLLAYRVQLLNSAGRAAGLSPVVLTVAGAAPAAVAGFAGDVTNAGVELRWQPAAAVAGSSEVVELDRVVLDPAAATSPARRSGLPGEQKQTTEIRMRAGEAAGPGATASNAGAADAGGTVDRTVEVGHSYRYVAQRVETVTLGGRKLEVGSILSAPLTFAVRDSFPPDVPAGLVAVPGFAADGSGAQQRPAIDLSWEPDLNPDVIPRVAGYKVYRRDASTADSADAWRLLTPSPVTDSAYRDLAVAPGQRYAYRVTAVSTAGNESAPGGEAAETAPQPQ